MEEDCEWSLRPALWLGFPLGISPHLLRSVPRPLLLGFAIVLHVYAAAVQMYFSSTISLTLESNAEISLAGVAGVAQASALVLSQAREGASWTRLWTYFRAADSILPPTTNTYTWARYRTLGLLITGLLFIIAQVWLSSLAWHLPSYYLVGSCIKAVVLLVVELEYTNIALMVRDRFRIVNESLKEVRARREAWTVRKKNSLRRLQRMHWHLTEVCQSANSLLAFPVMFDVAYLWMQLLLVLYYTFFNASTFGGEGNVVKAGLAVHMTRRALSTFVLAWSCDTTVAEGRSASRLLAGMLTGRLAGRALYFVAQVEVAPPSLGSLRLFAVNLRLLFAFYSTLVGYLLLMLQAGRAQ